MSPQARRATLVFVGLMVVLTIGMLAIANRQAVRSRQQAAKKMAHQSVGVFLSGELATMNGLSGSVTVAPASSGPAAARLTLDLTDQQAHPVSNAHVQAHGVLPDSYTAYMDLDPDPATPGRYTGDLPHSPGVTVVMVHADLPGGIEDEWVAEWTVPHWQSPPTQTGAESP